MAKYLQIHIDTPCHQNWEDMQSSPVGNFCNSCQKNVIDFTGMTDSQLIAYFKNKPAGVCGKFYTDQLEKPIEVPVKKIPWLKYFFQISLPALLFSYKANAQRLVKKYKEPLQLTEKKVCKTLPLASDIIVSGKITGKAGESVAFASVMIKGAKEGVAADSNGLFTLKLTGEQRFLEITAAGYEKKLVTITNSQTDIKLNIGLSENINLATVTVNSNTRRYTMGGAMSSVYIYRIKDSRKKDIISTTSSMILFPNPAKRNSLLTIRWKQPVHNDQQVILYNASGIKLLQETIYVKQNLQETQVDLNVNTAGFYTVQVVDMKTGKKQVEKLIIE